MLVAFTGGAVIGIPLGLGIGSSRRVAAIVNPLIEFYRPLPPLAYYTLLVDLARHRRRLEDRAAAARGLPPVVIATASAVRDVRGDYARRAFAWRDARAGVPLRDFPERAARDLHGPPRLDRLHLHDAGRREMVAGLNGVGWMVLDASKFLQSDVIFVGIFLMGATRRSRSTRRCA